MQPLKTLENEVQKSNQSKDCMIEQNDDDKLLSFRPFCPTTADISDKDGWLKRKIRSAGSTLSKLRGSSNKSECSKKNSEIESPSLINTSDMAFQQGSKSAESKEAIKIISYSSVRSDSSTPSLRTSVNDDDVAESKGLSTHVLTTRKVTSKNLKGIVNIESPPKKNIETPELQSVTSKSSDEFLNKLSVIEGLLAKDKDYKSYVETCSSVAHKLSNSVEFSYEGVAQECQFNPDTFNIHEPSCLEKIRISNSKENTTRVPIIHDKSFRSKKEEKEKKVEFAPSKENDLQEYDSNMPPSATERGKINNVSGRKNGILINSKNRGTAEQAIDKSWEEISKLGPIPFTDFDIKEKVVALFELMGAPEEFKQCNDLRLSLACLHPCLSKLLNFFWSIINNGLEENKWIKETAKQLEKQNLIDAGIYEMKNREFHNLASIHVSNLNELERTVENLKIEIAQQQSHNDKTFEEVNNAMVGMTGVLKNFFSQDFYQEWKDDTKYRIDSLMVYLNAICDYFCTIQQNMALDLESCAEKDALRDQLDFYADNCRILERENESLRAVAQAYHCLQDVITKKNVIINSLKSDNYLLNKEVEKKTRELELSLVKHENEIAKLASISLNERRRVLDIWEKSDYEQALMANEEEILELKNRIDILDSIIHNKDAKRKNSTNRLNFLETKVATLSKENTILTAKYEKTIEQKRDALRAFDLEFKKRLEAMRSELEKKTDIYNDQIKKYKRQYENTLNNALKVTLQAESIFQALSNNKNISSNKALRYFTKKRAMFKSVKETILSNTSVDSHCDSEESKYKSASNYRPIGYPALDSNKNIENEDVEYFSLRRKDFNDSLIELREVNVNNRLYKGKSNAKQIIKKLREWKKCQEQSQNSPNSMEFSLELSHTTERPADSTYATCPAT
ncbi:hypothetical protein C6P43_002226 [Kluyveromyces marxianus]|nr:hypothetical protein C6P43_002226 [Kluyveromyces marxianus]